MCVLVSPQPACPHILLLHSQAGKDTVWAEPFYTTASLMAQAQSVGWHNSARLKAHSNSLSLIHFCAIKDHQFGE